MQGMQPPPEPQPVLTPLTEAAIFLVLTIDPGGEDDVRDLLADRRRAGRGRSASVSPTAAWPAWSGIGSQRWDRLFAGPARPSCTRSGRSPAPHHAVSTPGDLLFHIRARQMDLCFELAVSWSWTGWPARCRVVDEVHGFKYFDERDLLGFVDGTENPTGAGRRRGGDHRRRGSRLSPAAATSSSRSTCTTWPPGTR